MHKLQEKQIQLQLFYHFQCWCHQMACSHTDKIHVSLAMDGRGYIVFVDLIVVLSSQYYLALTTVF